MPKQTTKVILNVDQLCVGFKTQKRFFEAVSNISFSLKAGEIIGLVGESGSGKSTIGRTVMGLNDFYSGTIKVNDLILPNKVNNISYEMRKSLSRHIQYIFQDPQSALNPNKTIEYSINETLKSAYPYQKYLKTKWALIFDQYITEATYQTLYGDLKLTNKQKEANHKIIQARQAEELANDQYFNNLNKIYIKYYKAKGDNYLQQKNGQITDQEFRKNAQTYRLKLKQEKAELNQKYRLRLTQLEHPRQIKMTHDLYQKFVQQLRNKALQLLIKQQFSVQNFLKLIKSKFRKNFNQQIEQKILSIIAQAQKVKLLSRKEYFVHNLQQVSKLTSLNKEIYKKYPRELSGGQQQRAVLARALTLKPKILIADEPVSALDVSIQSQVINSFRNIAQQENIGIIFIAHDLNIVRNISQRILVMYRGNIVEMGTVNDIFKRPLHPYTKVLLQSIPHLERYTIPQNLTFSFQEANRKWIQISSTHRLFATAQEAKIWQRSNNEV